MIRDKWKNFSYWSINGGILTRYKVIRPVSIVIIVPVLLFANVLYNYVSVYELIVKLQIIFLYFFLGNIFFCIFTYKEDKDKYILDFGTLYFIFFQIGGALLLIGLAGSIVTLPIYIFKKWKKKEK